MTRAEMEKLGRELAEGLLLWEAFWNDMPKGQLGKICCNIGLLNNAFLKMGEMLPKARKAGWIK